MARTMSSSEAEHERRVSESCGPRGNVLVCTGHHHPMGIQPGLCHGQSEKAVGNRDAGGWGSLGTEGKGVAAAAGR